MFKKMILFIGFIYLITGCTSQQVKKQESAFIVMKTKKMKFADMGFIYDLESKVKIEIYAAGQPLVDLEINAQNICLSTFQCMEKKTFNEQFLVAKYPETLLENIFKAKPIFAKTNLVKSEDGFKQIIKKDGVYDISYSVKSGQRTFRDTINKILIKVREQ